MKKAEMTAAKKRSRLGAYNRKDIIFYAALMAFPVVQFLIFYIVVNANSLLLTFRSYDTLTGEVFQNDTLHVTGGTIPEIKVPQVRTDVAFKLEKGARQ